MSSFAQILQDYFTGSPPTNVRLVEAIADLLRSMAKFPFIGSYVKSARKYQVGVNDAKASLLFLQGHSDAAVNEFRSSLGNKFWDYFGGTVNEEKCLAILWVVVFDHFQSFLSSMNDEGYVMRGGRYTDEELREYWKFIGFKGDIGGNMIDVEAAISIDTEFGDTVSQNEEEDDEQNSNQDGEEEYQKFEDLDEFETKDRE